MADEEQQAAARLLIFLLMDADEHDKKRHGKTHPWIQKRRAERYINKYYS